MDDVIVMKKVWYVLVNNFFYLYKPIKYNFGSYKLIKYYDIIILIF